MHVRLAWFNGQKQPHPQAPVLFVSQPTGRATMQHWLHWHKNLDTDLGARLIFIVKVTVVGYFDSW